MNSRLMIGERFNRLVVISVSDKPYYFDCICDCGRKHIVSKSNLLLAKVKSCGCLRVEVSSYKATTHGCSKTYEFKSWAAMKQRCYDINSSNYERYGARGIKVCDRWINSFENFLEDMGMKPTKYHSIERLDNNKNYDPGNCKWATTTEQSRNKRNNHLITIDGVTAPLAAWAEKHMIDHRIVWKRIKRGWKLEDLFIPKVSNGIGRYAHAKK